MTTVGWLGVILLVASVAAIGTRLAADVWQRRRPPPP